MNDVAARVMESELPPQAGICHRTPALPRFVSIFLTLLLSLLAGVSVSAAASEHSHRGMGWSASHALASRTDENGSTVG
jgi:hypothetical protein